MSGGRLSKKCALAIEKKQLLSRYFIKIIDYRKLYFPAELDLIAIPSEL